MAQVKSVRVCLNVPLIGQIEGTWEPDVSEQKAAWEMYVELVTRTTVVDLKDDEGLLREALSSLHSLFDTTRGILREYGPSVAQPKNGGSMSFGYLAVSILNGVIRPLLSKWHPLLLDYENKRKVTVSPAEHERAWERSQELREDLRKVRSVMVDYANILARVAGVPSLIEGKACSGE